MVEREKMKYCGQDNQERKEMKKLFLTAILASSMFAQQSTDYVFFANGAWVICKGLPELPACVTVAGSPIVYTYFLGIKASNPNVDSYKYVITGTNVTDGSALSATGIVIRQDNPAGYTSVSVVMAGEGKDWSIEVQEKMTTASFRVRR